MVARCWGLKLFCTECSIWYTFNVCTNIENIFLYFFSEKWKYALTKQLWWKLNKIKSKDEFIFLKFDLIIYLRSILELRIIPKRFTSLYGLFRSGKKIYKSMYPNLFFRSAYFNRIHHLRCMFCCDTFYIGTLIHSSHAFFSSRARYIICLIFLKLICWLTFSFWEAFPFSSVSPFL